MKWTAYLLTMRAARQVANLFPIDVIREVPIPEGPVVFAFNHHSFLDPVVAGATGERPIRFLATDEIIGHYRVLDWALEVLNAIPINKQTVPLGPIRQALAALAAGISVGIFPEGERTHEWGDAPVKRGGPWLAIRAGVPLIPVALLGTNDAMPIRHDTKLRIRRRPMRVWSGAPLWPKEFDGDSHAMLEAWRVAVDEVIREYGAGEGI